VASSERLGNIRITVDGSWDISNLLALSEGLADSYGFFYLLIADNEEVRTRLHDQLRRIFWSGEIETRHIGRDLYNQIPIDESLKLRKFQYSSLGYVELYGALACLAIMARVARSWVKTFKDLLDLWEEVDTFFAKRKHLRRPRRKMELDDNLALNSDEARALCFKVGEQLGFEHKSCESLIVIVGNPIAALKYLVAAGNEGRKLAQLENGGLLQLPETSAEFTIHSSREGERRGRSGIVVERANKRKPKK
jgi:hypothetical protein